VRRGLRRGAAEPQDVEAIVTISIPEVTPRLAAVRTLIEDRPWRAVAGALLLGAYAGWATPRLPRGRFARAGLAMIGAVAVRAARDGAIQTLLAGARDWLSVRPAPAAPARAA
jgi:hypothetical protein